MNKTIEYENEDVFDSRNVEERIEELEEQEQLNEEELEELRDLNELKEECLNYGWENGIQFIRESYFEEYAEELFNECYVSSVPDMVNNYIDYKKFASDLQMDYSEIEFRGITFFWREE